MGNCGVGFAPCRREHREFTDALMEGVEDIPAEVLNEGLDWRWESFPEYLDVLRRREFDMNVGGLLQHSALRVYVMGDRAISDEPASAADVHGMAPRPEVRGAILAEARAAQSDKPSRIEQMSGLLFPVRGSVVNEPQAEASIGAAAEAAGCTVNELIYDELTADEGRGMLLLASGNYADFSLEPALEMMRFEQSVPGLGDAGAHCTVVCDASATTYMLTYWARDRTLGERLSVPFVVKRLARDPARLFGLTERGVIAWASSVEIAAAGVREE